MTTIRIQTGTRCQWDGLTLVEDGIPIVELVIGGRRFTADCSDASQARELVVKVARDLGLELPCACEGCVSPVLACTCHGSAEVELKSRGAALTEEERSAVETWALGELGHTQRTDIPRAICTSVLSKVKTPGVASRSPVRVSPVPRIELEPPAPKFHSHVTQAGILMHDPRCAEPYGGTCDQECEARARAKETTVEITVTPLAEPPPDLDPGSFAPWPANKPARYNGAAEPCDMWTGPCCCGAWHKDGK